MLALTMSQSKPLTDFRDEPILERVQRRVMKKAGWSHDRVVAAREAFFEYFFKADPDAEPEEDVDEYWHHFILHTKDYGMFCQKYLGRFLHHNPCEGLVRCDCKGA